MKKIILALLLMFASFTVGTDIGIGIEWINDFPEYLDCIYHFLLICTIVVFWSSICYYTAISIVNQKEGDK